MCRICDENIDVLAPDLGQTLIDKGISLKELQDHKMMCLKNTGVENKGGMKAFNKLHTLSEEHKVKIIEQVTSAVLRTCLDEAKELGLPTGRTMSILLGLNKINPIINIGVDKDRHITIVRKIIDHDVDITKEVSNENEQT
jgi:hypothetical protein